MEQGVVHSFGHFRRGFEKRGRGSNHDAHGKWLIGREPCEILVDSAAQIFGEPPGGFVG
jgi:hypothetical protein